MSEEKQWRKVLYEHQPFPDNYTSETFLYEMKKNGKYILFQILTAFEFNVFI